MSSENVSSPSYTQPLSSLAHIRNAAPELREEAWDATLVNSWLPRSEVESFLSVYQLLADDPPVLLRGGRKVEVAANEDVATAVANSMPGEDV